MDYRPYDNVLGRFHGVDLLSELDYSGSPYTFGLNNPVYFSDPSGLTGEGSDTDPPRNGILLDEVKVKSNYKKPEVITHQYFYSGVDYSSSFLDSFPGGIPMVSNGGGGGTLTPAGLVSIGSDPIVAAMMKNYVFGGQNSNSYDSPFFTNQYFSGETSLRAGYFLDIGIKKIAQISLGEYMEKGYKVEYYNNKCTVSEFENHYFEASIAAIYGISVKYDLDKSRFDSFSLTEYGIGIEFSRLSTYNWQVFFGFESGINGGFILGGAASGKGGWLIK